MNGSKAIVVVICLSAAGVALIAVAFGMGAFPVVGLLFTWAIGAVAITISLIGVAAIAYGVFLRGRHK